MTHAGVPPDGLELLLFQATPFCNIDCKYCYLPNRRDSRRMRPETVERSISAAIEGGFVNGQQGIDINWHIGEPLSVPIDYFRQLLDAVDSANRGRVRISYSVQTNGTLITQPWCDFLKEHGFGVGVSIDGPAFIHDARRKTRSGRGTHTRVMQGIRLLQQNGIPFVCLAVVTQQSLLFPDELVDFFLQSGINNIAFNREDIVGSNLCTSLTGIEHRNTLRFMVRLLERIRESGGQLRVREFAAVSHWLRRNGRSRSSTSTPFAVLSIDVDGYFSTFSPQLLGHRSPEFETFALGNVHDAGEAGNAFLTALQSERFSRLRDAITAGVVACKNSCPYFGVCGGGDPANKLFERSTFACSETEHCKFHVKAPLDALILMEDANGHACRSKQFAEAQESITSISSR